MPLIVILQMVAGILTVTGSMGVRKCVWTGFF
jgi:hypothetical protein